MTTQIRKEQIKNFQAEVEAVVAGFGGAGAYNSISTSQTITTSNVYGVDCSGGNIVLTLTDGTTAGAIATIKKLDGSENTITVENANIDGYASIIISMQGESYDLYRNGSAFIIL